MDDTLFTLVVLETRHELFRRAAEALTNNGEAAGRKMSTTDLFDILTDTSRFDDPFANAVIVARHQAAVGLLETDLELDPKDVLDTLRDWTGAGARRSPARLTPGEADE